MHMHHKYIVLATRSTPICHKMCSRYLNHHACCDRGDREVEREITLMLVQPKPDLLPESILLNPAYLRAKRRLDIAVTLLLLPFLGIVMALIALAIRLDSKGPVFFRQIRIGQNGKAFTLLKFRSMIVQHDDALHRTAVRQF